MPKKRLGAEQIVTKLRQIEVLQGHGKSLAVACKEVGTTEQSYYRYRKEYGGLGVDQAKRLKRLEEENNRLKKLVADLSLEKQVLKDIARGNWETCNGAGRRLMRLVRNMGLASGQPAGSSGNRGGRSAMFPPSSPMRMS